MTHKEAFNFIISVLLKVVATGEVHEKINRSMHIIKGQMCLEGKPLQGTEKFKKLLDEPNSRHSSVLPVVTEAETHKVLK